MGRQRKEVLQGKQFDDTDCLYLNTIRKGLEKEASKLARSETIIYSSSGVFMFFVTKQPSVSTFLNSVGVEAKIDRREISSIIADRKSISLVYIGAHVAYVSIQNQINVLPEEVRMKFINRSKSIHPEDSVAQFKLLADITTTSEKTGEKPVESDVSYNAVCCAHLLVSSANLKLLADITTTSDKTIEELIKMQSFARAQSTYFHQVHEKDFEPYIKDIASQMQSFARAQSTYFHQVHEKDFEPYIKDIASQPKNAAAEERSKHESTTIKLYRNVIRNETCIMMASIDMVMAEAEHLFGHERTRIFLDLLDNELFQFGPTGATSNFANMTDSTVRQHVISFFELACDMMNRLKTLLLGCPDRKRLQQMPEQNFISLTQSVIDSSLKTKAKGGKRLSSKGSTLIMVDSEEFERVLGEEIPENVLDRLRRGDEMVVHRFVDTRLERTQASERRENRTIYSIYFPSDRHLSIYIRTENGSYWHQLDMQRASRINMLKEINNFSDASSSYNSMFIKCSK